MIGCTRVERARPAAAMPEGREPLTRFGFRFGRGGAHSARTMMLEELTTLLAYVNRPDADRSDYLRAIDEDNCLGKRSGKTRGLTRRHLLDLYSLDPGNVLFRALVYFWSRDEAGRPLLALLCAYARDSVFRSTAPFVLKTPAGAAVTRESLEAFIDSREPGRFSKATLKSTAQNINSTWTQSGHLNGRAKKTRARATATAGSAAYALLLGFLSGARGQGLFCTEYTKLLDCPPERVIELAEDASRKGWIVFKRVGDVMEVMFPNFVRQEEQEWLREQG